jgi:hypothetical protein
MTAQLTSPRIRAAWHRVRMAIHEMNYATRRLVELQAFGQQTGTGA